jgi:hypothetical protein
MPRHSILFSADIDMSGSVYDSIDFCTDEYLLGMGRASVQDSKR